MILSRVVFRRVALQFILNAMMQRILKTHLNEGRKGVSLSEVNLAFIRERMILCQIVFVDDSLYNLFSTQRSKELINSF